MCIRDRLKELPQDEIQEQAIEAPKRQENALETSEELIEEQYSVLLALND